MDHMFEGSASYESKRQYNVIERQLLAIIPIPKKAVKWSNTAITFNEDDCPKNLIQPKHPMGAHRWRKFT